MLKLAAILSAIMTDGVNRFVSTVLIVLRDTLIASASSCCESPASLRNFAMLFCTFVPNLCFAKELIRHILNTLQQDKTRPSWCETLLKPNHLRISKRHPC
mgnify:CR=1 FL=1